jgi:hypothetical protein
MHDFEINIEISAIATSLHHWQGENQLWLCIPIFLVAEWLQVSQDSVPEAKKPQLLCVLGLGNSVIHRRKEIHI